MKKELELDLSSKKKVVVEKYLPPLSYELIEGNFKHLQGQILTVIEATVEKEKLTATKSLIKGFVNDKLTHIFDMFNLYGMGSEEETPDYDKE